MRSILLATALATAYALLRGWPENAHPLLRAVLAVFVLVLGLALWRHRRKPAGTQTTAIRPAHWTHYLAMGLGILSLECLFLFFVTFAPPRAEALALSLEETLRPEAAARRAAAGGYRTATNISGNWLWDSLGRRRLPSSTNARPGNKPEAFFRAADSATAKALLKNRAYLSSFALELYDDASWAPEPIPPLALNPDPSGQVTLPQPPNRPSALLSGEIFHSTNTAGQDVLTTLQNPVSVSLPGMRQVSPGIIRLAPLANPDDGYDYQTSSRPLSVEQLVTLQLSNRIQPGTDQPESLLALPSDSALRDNILQIAGRTQGPLELRLAAIRKFLRSNCTYSLKVDNLDNLDPIENFLFHERRGHCEFFATSGALLCRALNIPSRVAYGWSGGRYFQSQNLFMFRAREAHAWTEIYLKDYGWVIFDCTPPGALDAATSSLAPPDERAPLSDDGEFLDEEELAETTLGIWPWIVLGTGITLLPFVALLLAMRKRPRPGPTPDTALLTPEPPSYLTRFKQACQHQGHPMPPGRTLRQQLQSLEQQSHSLDFANELLDYHYTTTYGTTPPDKSKERHLSSLISSW